VSAQKRHRIPADAVESQVAPVGLELTPHAVHGGRRWPTSVGPSAAGR